jgi:hypothetical protein
MLSAAVLTVVDARGDAAMTVLVGKQLQQSRIQQNRIQMEQNTTGTEYKWNRMEVVGRCQETSSVLCYMPRTAPCSSAASRVISVGAPTCQAILTFLRWLKNCAVLADG